MSNEATRWAARRILGPLSAEDQDRFDSWLADDPRNEGALIRAETGLALIARARIMTPTSRSQPSLSRRRMVGWGAGLAIAATAAGLWLLPGDDMLTTRTGEIRRLQLADASRVTLNTQSRISVDMEPDERRIALQSGEAWFQVAHNRARPFVVSVGDLQVRAVGTAFSVRRLADGADVLVTEGKVEVWRAAKPGMKTAVDKGRRAFAADDSAPIVAVKASGGIERALAWRSGRLALAGETIDYAVSEMNRYNVTQLKIADPELGRKPIIGRFKVDDPMAFARSVALFEHARVARDGEIIRLIPMGS